MQPYAHSRLCIFSVLCYAFSAIPSTPFLRYPTSTKRSPDHPAAGLLLLLVFQIRPKTKISEQVLPGCAIMGLPRLNTVFPVSSSLIPPRLLQSWDQPQLHVVSTAQYLSAC